MTNQVYIHVPEIDWSGLPLSMRGRYSAVCRSKAECEDLVKWFGGAEFAPFLPVLLLIPGTEPVQIAGQGWAPAAELRDDAVGIWEIVTERLAKHGRAVDFDSLREKHGLMRKEDVEPAFKEAVMERVRRHKASPVTDPGRQPHYPRVRGKTVHTVAVLDAGS